MKIVARVTALIIVIAVGVWVWRTFFPSPTVQVRRRLESLAKTATFSARDGVLVKGLKAQRVPDFFAPQFDVIVDVPRYGRHILSSRDKMEEIAGGLSQQPGAVTCKFPDINVTVNLGGESAVADVTWQFTGGQLDILEELDITLVKTNGDWLITRVQSVPAVTLPGVPRQ